MRERGEMSKIVPLVILSNVGRSKCQQILFTFAFDHKSGYRWHNITVPLVNFSMREGSEMSKKSHSLLRLAINRLVISPRRAAPCPVGGRKNAYVQ